MITINLNRLNKQGKAVNGTMTFMMRNRLYDQDLFTHPTLENADFLIPEGTYPVERTWSPRFRKFLPEIQNVPERSGIRIHRGTLPEHSQGCILTDMRGMANLDVLFNQVDFRENESVQIVIRSEQTQD